MIIFPLGFAIFSQYTLSYTLLHTVFGLGMRNGTFFTFIARFLMISRQINNHSMDACIVTAGRAHAISISANIQLEKSDRKFVTIYNFVTWELCD
jgi:hypothetical protein